MQEKFAAGFLQGYVNNLMIENSFQMGTDMAAKIIQKIGAISVKLIFFFLLKLPFPFFGLTTLFLYFFVKRSIAILFLFFKLNIHLFLLRINFHL